MLHPVAAERAVETAEEQAERGVRKLEDAATEARRRAEAELGRRREAAEAARTTAQGRGEVPGLSAIGVELALGAMRLARTIATAPVRIGLAFLRSREP